MKKIFFIVCIITAFVSPSFAGDNVGEPGGTITLVDNDAARPGIIIDLSANTAAGYAATANVGGYANTAGLACCIVTGSPSVSDTTIALYFGVRTANEVGLADDNNVYQMAPGAAIVPATCLSHAGSTDITAWKVRGSS